MHKPISVLENEKHKIFQWFGIQKDHLIQTRRQDLITINKKQKCQMADFAVQQTME